MIILTLLRLYKIKITFIQLSFSNFQKCFSERYQFMKTQFFSWKRYKKTDHIFYYQILYSHITLIEVVLLPGFRNPFKFFYLSSIYFLQLLAKKTTIHFVRTTFPEILSCFTSQFNLFIVLVFQTSLLSELLNHS